jgi:hypothetical protein
LASSLGFCQTVVFDLKIHHRPGSVDESFPPLALNDRDGNDIYIDSFGANVVVQADGKVVVFGSVVMAKS